MKKFNSIDYLLAVGLYASIMAIIVGLIRDSYAIFFCSILSFIIATGVILSRGERGNK